MAGKKTKLEPSRKGTRDLKEWAGRARAINERLKAEGRWFGDSTGIVRADRDSRV
ncbi:hypothetical protein BH18ACT10_BH18ACT10_15740 [soil metagenome]|nr:hypothetical protein [Rubrobacter sp.]